MSVPELSFSRAEPISVRTSNVDPTGIAAMSDADLDELPFGVIELDRDGVIHRYNLAESRFARLDRASVLGKRFFQDVAPCTRTPEFQGRVDEYFALPLVERADVRQFSYLFDFKFGAQEVSVEIVRSPNADRVVLCVNRLSFDQPRSGLPEGFAAFSQAELAPDEREHGVHRDTQEQRFVRVPVPFFRALHQTWTKLAPNGWRVFSRPWGITWGRRSVVELETAALEAEAKALRELPMKTVLSLVREWSRAQGWGDLRPDFSPARQGAFVVHLERSALAEAVGMTGQAGCALIEGWLAAVFSHLARRKLTTREIQCRCQGDDECVFVVVSEDREAELERASENVRDVSRVVEGLRKGRSRS